MNSKQVKAGEVGVVCPVCDLTIMVAVSCVIVQDPDAGREAARLVCEPETADLWAHMWAHDDKEPTE